MKMKHDFEKVRRGSAADSAGKTRITMYLDDSVLAHFRKKAATEGIGYQTAINRALAETIEASKNRARVDIQEVTVAVDRLDNAFESVRSAFSEMQVLVVESRGIQGGTERGVDLGVGDDRRLVRRDSMGVVSSKGKKNPSAAPGKARA